MSDTSTRGHRDAGTPVDGAESCEATILDALDAAGRTQEGFNFHNGRGVLTEALGYARLAGEAKALAEKLLGAGVAPGDRAALIADTEGDFVRLFFACLYAGAVPVPMPLPMAFGGRENYLATLRGMIEVADAAAAFAPSGMRDWLKEAAAGLPLRLVGTLGDLESVEGAGALRRPDPEALAYLQFSSGSTRFPKGVSVTHRSLMANAAAISRHGLETRPGDRCVSWLPFYHDMGLVGFMLSPIVAGLSVDYLATRDFARRPLLWLEMISRAKATISYSPSFGFELAAQRAATVDLGALDVSSWRCAGIGGDMIRPHVLRRFAERFGRNGFAPCAYVASYGMAETTLALSFAPLGAGMKTETVDLDRLEGDGVTAPPAVEAARSREFVLCGPALPGHEIEVRGAGGSRLPERRVGKIFARGPSLMRDYFREPEETAAALVDGWLDTGDLGYLSGDEIVITGRAKDLILVNGRNVWPQDLEWAAEAGVPGLRSGDVAVFSVDRDDGEQVVALVQCRSSDPAVRGALEEGTAKLLLQQFGTPVTVRLVGAHALPVTSSGKLSRSRAKLLFLSLRDAAA